MVMNSALIDFITSSPTPFHAVAQAGSMLDARGYTHLCESEPWQLEPGKGYYVTRNGSSLIAFRIPGQPARGFMMAAAHCDSPCFKVKANCELADDHYVRISTETYGGALYAPWMDRPLSIAGRIAVRTKGGVEVRLVDLKDRATLVIPNVAIHMNREANTGLKYNPAIDLVPLYGGKQDKGKLFQHISDCTGVPQEDILSTDLYVYNPEPGRIWGDYISAPRLDNLQCSFAALSAFLAADESTSTPVYCLFDNEEVGSQTKQGAASTFLADVLIRIAGDSDTLRRYVANSFLVSCDNAHAVHPNHPELADKNHPVYMNGGIVIKYNANQRYTSDAVSAAIFRLVCEDAKVPFQAFANRSDMPGGSTLGNIANTQVSLNTVDVGLAQLAMHSSYETAGTADTEYLIRALTVFYSKTLLMQQDGSYQLI